MSHLIPRPLLCLGLGLFTTIAIAWASAAMGWPQTPRFTRLPNPPVARAVYQNYTVVVARRPGWECVLWCGPVRAEAGEEFDNPPPSPAAALASLRAVGLFPFAWGRSSTWAPDAATTRFTEHILEARGWPMLAVWCEWRTDSSRATATMPVLGGVPLPGLTNNRFITPSTRALPYRPIPLGLLADTLFFALAWSALLFAPRAIRRRIRIARNQCQRCAYNLAGLPPQNPCPECGHAPPPPTEPRP